MDTISIAAAPTDASTEPDNPVTGHAASPGSWGSIRQLVLTAATGPGVVALIGAPGTGKSVLLRSVARALTDIGQPASLVRHAWEDWSGVGCTVLVDEADKLDVEALRRVCERARTVVLAGLPPLLDRLETIAARIRVLTLEPLGPDEVAAFVRTELARAGGRTIDEDAMELLAAKTAGILRDLRILLGLCAFAAGRDGAQHISRAHVETALHLRHGEGLAAPEQADAEREQAPPAPPPTEPEPDWTHEFSSPLTEHAAVHEPALTWAHEFSVPLAGYAAMPGPGRRRSAHRSWVTLVAITASLIAVVWPAEAPDPGALTSFTSSEAHAAAAGGAGAANEASLQASPPLVASGDAGRLAAAADAVLPAPASFSARALAAVASGRGEAETVLPAWLSARGDSLAIESLGADAPVQVQLRRRLSLDALPARAAVRVVLTFPVRDQASAIAAQTLAARLTTAAVPVQLAQPRRAGAETGVLYFFAEDGPAAQGVADALGLPLRPVPRLTRTPDLAPGTVEVALPLPH